MEETSQKHMTEAEARARSERLREAGVKVTGSGPSVVTFLGERTDEGFDESAPERDDDGTGVDE